MKTLLRTNDWWTSLVVRVALGIVMVPHGAQKLLGWFGGGGLWATVTLFSEKLHISAGLTILVIVSELLGGLGLIAGFLTRVCAFGVLCVMAGAVVLVHWPHGFFMNWFGNQAEPFEVDRRDRGTQGSHRCSRRASVCRVSNWSSPAGLTSTAE